MLVRSLVAVEQPNIASRITRNNNLTICLRATFNELVCVFILSLLSKSCIKIKRFPIPYQGIGPDIQRNDLLEELCSSFQEQFRIFGKYPVDPECDIS
jgi:hypothetical protein